MTERVWLHDANHSDPTPCASLDVGIGGICVQLPEAVSLESIRTVSLTVGRRQLELHANGVWRRDRPKSRFALAGISFEETDAEQSAALWKLMTGRALELSRFLIERSVLAGIEPDIAMDIAFRTRRRPFDVAERLYRRGGADPDDRSIYLVMSGAVEMERNCGGREVVSLGRATQGDVVGGLPAVAGIGPIDSAVCREAVELLEIDEHSFATLRSEKPVVAQHLARAVMASNMRLFESLDVA